ncbi:hypothetical protein [Haloferula sp.]|uniref:hypothetical protein n=1 Tax=Haloferula sp. TaxID=2497595 RepID=UPI003C71191B
MDLPPLGPVPFVPIPKVFFSAETGRPFEKCISCRCELGEDGTAYLIEKGFHRGETAFEYAMCFDCHSQIATEISPASMKRIAHYFGERVDLVDRQKAIAARDPADWEAWISQCFLSGKPLGDEYQIYGQCDGGDLMLAYLPYAIGGEELENLAQILSKETRGRIDDFVDDFLGVPGSGLRIPMPL